MAITNDQRLEHEWGTTGQAFVIEPQEYRTHDKMCGTLAKRLVTYAKDTKAALVLEELTNIRSRMTVRKKQRSKQHNWSFRQLRDFLVYKAQRAGIPLLFVDPRNSSRTCNRCGYVDKKNRRSQAEFSCLRCGHHTHADINAAKNLAVRGEVTRPDLLAPPRGQLAFAW
jgi:IS605 OrfB family transposase